MRSVFFLLALFVAVSVAQYQPTWESLDARPLPGWYDDAKFGSVLVRGTPHLLAGIFIHWGLFSVPSWSDQQGHAGEWYWWYKDGEKVPAYSDFQADVYGKDFQYADFAHKFGAEFFNATEWATIFKNSGAQYVVLTSKHHEGWCNWPSDQAWNWNSPHRDLVGELSKAVSGAGLTMGLYHSLFEWFNPLYLKDKAAGYNTTVYVDEVLIPQLKDIVTRYNPAVVWSDGGWDTSDVYWKSKEFLAWLYNDSPVKDVVVTNDRWGKDDECKHGGYWTCNDRYDPGHVVQHKWENCMTIDKGSWGWDRTSPLEKYYTVGGLLKELAETVAFGGNLLLNVGPTADGRIPIVFQDRLQGLGAWLSVNGDAIYKTNPWKVAQNQSETLWYTQSKAKPTSIYAITIEYASPLVLKVPVATAETVVTLLGYDAPLVYKQGSEGLSIVMPCPLKLSDYLRGAEAWVLRLDGITQ